MTQQRSRALGPCTKCFRKEATVTVGEVAEIPPAMWPTAPSVCKSCSYEMNGTLAYLRFYGVGTVYQPELIDQRDPAKVAQVDRATESAMPQYPREGPGYDGMQADSDGVIIEPPGKSSPPTPPGLNESPPAFDNTPEVKGRPDSDVTSADRRKTKAASKSPA